MTSQEEQYIHFASCIENLNNAWRILKIIKRRKGNSLIWAAFQFALIEYSKPYTNSRGLILRNYKLDESFIPLIHIDLHRRVLNSRNQILAHADLTVKEAKLHVDKIKKIKFVGIVQNTIRGTEELPNIDAVVNLIEMTLDNMYLEEERLKGLLPLTS
jgi:hypothetical protein